MFDQKNLIPIVIFLFAAIVGYGVLRPQWARIGGMQSEYVNADKTIQTAQGDQARTSALVDSWEGLDISYKNRALNALPSDLDLPNLLVLLEDAVGRSGLSLNGISIAEDSPKEAAAQADEVGQAESPLKEAKATIIAEGGYFSIKELAKILENQLRLADIESIHIAPVAPEKEREKEGIKPGLLKATITVKTYYFSN